MIESFLISILGGGYAALGIIYIATGNILWGFLTLTLSAVYFFGFEKVLGSGKEHKASHILTGGIFALIASGFLIIEWLVSLLSEPVKPTTVDWWFLGVSVVAFLGFLFARKKFV